MRTFALVGSLLLLASTKALAGSAAPGKLGTIHSFLDGTLIVYTSGARSDMPSCAVKQPGRFAVNTNTPGGKLIASTILAAYSIGKPAVIIGKGRCDVYGDTETISYLYTVD